jgi:hypothetical protein
LPIVLFVGSGTGICEASHRKVSDNSRLLMLRVRIMIKGRVRIRVRVRVKVKVRV